MVNSPSQIWAGKYLKTGNSQEGVRNQIGKKLGQFSGGKLGGKILRYDWSTAQAKKKEGNLKFQI